MQTIFNEWIPQLPPHDVINSEVQLLTIAGIAVKGVWSGRLGEHFTAWAPVAKLSEQAKERIKAMTTL